MDQRIILASTSPRRKAILEMLEIDFEVAAVEVDESIIPHERPYDYVHRLALAKAKSLADTGEKGIIIGGDVTIDVDGKALAKAESAAEARAMLRSLSGITNVVRDAFAIFAAGEEYASGVVSSFVTFKNLSEVEIDNYLSGGEWEGKAGAYAIQGEAAKFVAAIKGSYYDILGFPIYAVGAALMSLGIEGIPAKLEAIRQQDLLMVAQVLKKE